MQISYSLVPVLKCDWSLSCLDRKIGIKYSYWSYVLFHKSCSFAYHTPIYRLAESWRVCQDSNSFAYLTLMYRLAGSWRVCQDGSSFAYHTPMDHKGSVRMVAHLHITHQCTDWENCYFVNFTVHGLPIAQHLGPAPALSQNEYKQSVFLQKFHQLYSTTNVLYLYQTSSGQ